MPQRIITISLAILLSLTAVFAVHNTLTAMADSHSSSACGQQAYCHFNTDTINCVTHCISSALPSTAAAQTTTLFSALLSLSVVFTSILLMWAGRQTPLAVRALAPPRNFKYRTMTKRE
ncbi:MAG: hypothetical protein HY461_02095 [Parcubacteria group bacterium]|nr:hypothetical protein [Parcubacteria group bacterium]